MAANRLWDCLRRITVRKRMTLAFGLLVILPFILISAYILQSAYSGFRDRDRSYADDYARQSYIGINQLFLSLYDSFQNITGNSDILADVYNYIHVKQYRSEQAASQIQDAMWAGADINNFVGAVAIYTQNGDLFQSGYVSLSADKMLLLQNSARSAQPETSLMVLDDTPYLILYQTVALRYDQTDSALFAIGINLRRLSQKSFAYTAGKMQEMWVVDDQDRIIMFSGEETLLDRLSVPGDALISELESGGLRLVNRVNNYEGTELYGLALAIFTVAVLVFPLLLFHFTALSHSVTDPATRLLKKMEGMGRDEILVAGTAREETTPSEESDEMAELEREFAAMLQRIRLLIETVYLKEIDEQKLRYKIQELELNALQQQINPHFLYNVLDNIFWRSEMSGGGDTSKMITALGSYFKGSTDFKGILVTVESELQNIRSYLYLQKFMLGDRFQVSWRIDDRVSNLHTVKLILQPVVENAIVHGLADMETGGLIEIKAELLDDFLVFTIRDNGKGMDEQTLANLQKYVDSEEECGRSVGLRNVNRRIRNYYGRKDAGLCFESVPGQGTTTRISIPIQKGEPGSV